MTKPQVQKFGFSDTGFVATRVGDNSDLELLPARFELFASEVRDALAGIGKSLLPIMNRVEAGQTRHTELIAMYEQRMADHEKRTALLEARVNDLELARKAKAQRKPRKPRAKLIELKTVTG